MAEENELGQTAENLKSAGHEIAAEYGQKTEQVWDDARRRTRMLKEDIEEYVRDNPSTAMCMAVGIGLVLGLVIFRR